MIVLGILRRNSKLSTVVNLSSLIFLGVGCQVVGLGCGVSRWWVIFCPYMSLLGAFGAGCAAISSSTAAVGTSLDRAKCGKIFLAGFYANPPFRRVLFCHHHHHHFIIYPCRGGVGGVVAMTL